MFSQGKLHSKTNVFVGSIFCFLIVINSLIDYQYANNITELILVCWSGLVCSTRLVRSKILAVGIVSVIGSIVFCIMTSFVNPGSQVIENVYVSFLSAMACLYFVSLRCKNINKVGFIGLGIWCIALELIWQPIGLLSQRMYFELSYVSIFSVLTFSAIRKVSQWMTPAPYMINIAVIVSLINLFFSVAISAYYIEWTTEMSVPLFIKMIARGSVVMGIAGFVILGICAVIRYLSENEKQLK